MGRKRIHPTLPGETDAERSVRLKCEYDAKRMSSPGMAEANRARAKAWYAANAERGKTRAIAWAKANPSKKRAYNDAWAANNPEKYRLIHVNAQHRRRAKKSTGHVSRAEWSAIKEYFGHRCAYCLNQNDRLEMEHVEALSSGGDHAAHNIVPACRSCNARKNKKGILSMLRIAV